MRRSACLDGHQVDDVVSDGNDDYVYYLLEWHDSWKVAWAEDALKSKQEMVISWKGPTVDEIARMKICWPPSPGARVRTAQNAAGDLETPGSARFYPTNVAIVC